MYNYERFSIYTYVGESALVKTTKYLTVYISYVSYVASAADISLYVYTYVYTRIIL